MQYINLGGCLLFCLFIATGCLSHQETVNKSAAIQFTSDTLTTLDIKHGDTAYSTFEYSNTGNDTLIIQSIEHPCNCVNSDPLPIHLAPGMSGKLRIAYTPAPADSGLITKSIALRTNADTPIKFLYLRVSVLANTR